MQVYGEVAAFDSYAEADAWLGSLGSWPPDISGWYGFYKERGEQVSAVSGPPTAPDTFERSYGVEDVLIVGSDGISTRWVGDFEVLELADFEDVAAWADPVRPAAPASGPARGEPWEVEGWSYDLPSGTWLETELPTLQTWFLVCRYWGFGTRVGSNLFHVFG